MNVFLNIKLIARNWWRNKLFFSDFAIQSYSWIRMHQSAYDFFLSMNSHTMEFPDPCSYCIGNYNHYDNNT